jgi:hypothetical protein
MSDTTAEVVDQFDDATEEFPAKEDLKDRLVLIFVTGKHGMRKGSAPGSKPYAWFETITLVLDDGPNWDGTKIVDGEKMPMLVPSVKEEGVQRLDNFQYSQGGLTARLAPRVNLSPGQPPIGVEIQDKPKTFAPMLGRINSRKNSQPGFSASWSIGKPTDADKVVARKYNDLIAQITKELEKAGQPQIDGATDEFED